MKKLLQPHPPKRKALVELSAESPIWDHLFTIAPVVLIGMRDGD